MPKIQIIVTKEIKPDVRVEVNGVAGPACKVLTQPIEEALFTSVQHREDTAEMLQAPLANENFLENT